MDEFTRQHPHGLCLVERHRSFQLRWSDARADLGGVEPHPAPRPGRIHPYFGWRKAKKWILVGIANRGGSAPTAEVIDFVYANICDELLAL